jgi:hypothetical protein
MAVARWSYWNCSSSHSLPRRTSVLALRIVVIQATVETLVKTSIM